MHTHTEFGIPNSKSVGDMLRHNYSRNVLRGQGQQCPQKSNRHCHPKMHPHIKILDSYLK